MIKNLRILGTARSGTTLLWMLLLQNINTMGIYQPSTTRPGIAPNIEPKSYLSFKQDRFFAKAYQFLLGSCDTFQVNDVRDFYCDFKGMDKKIWISKDVIRASNIYSYKLFEPKESTDKIFNIFLFRHPLNYISSWNKEFKRGISQANLDLQVSSYKRLVDIVSAYVHMKSRNFIVLEFEAFTQNPEYFLEKINQKSHLGLSYNRVTYSKQDLGEKVLFGNQLQRKLVLGYKASTVPTYNSVNQLSQVVPIYSKAQLKEPCHINAAESLLNSYDNLVITTTISSYLI